MEKGVGVASRLLFSLVFDAVNSGLSVARGTRDAVSSTIGVPI